MDRRGKMEIALEEEVNLCKNYKKGKPSPLSYNKDDHIIDYSWYCRKTLFLASFLCGRETESIKDDPIFNDFMKQNYLTKGLNPTNRIPESKLTSRGIRELDRHIHFSSFPEKVRIWGRINFNI